MAIVFRNNNSNNLLLFFNGWAADERMIPSHPHMDMCILSEWHTISSFPYADWEKYKKIVLVAWSFGIVEATAFLEEKKLSNIVKTIAINGSPLFINDKYGIPEATFQATLKHFSPEKIQKFMFRIWGSAIAYKQNVHLHSKRSFQSIRDELCYFAKKEIQTTSTSLWDIVFIAEKDFIFPFENLYNYWETSSAVIIKKKDGVHYPFLPPFSWKDLKIQTQ